MTWGGRETWSEELILCQSLTYVLFSRKIFKSVEDKLIDLFIMSKNTSMYKDINWWQDIEKVSCFEMVRGDIMVTNKVSKIYV